MPTPDPAQPPADTLVLAGIPHISVRAVAQELRTTTVEAATTLARLALVLGLRLPLLRLHASMHYYNLHALARVLHRAGNPQMPADSLPQIQAEFRALTKHWTLRMLQRATDHAPLPWPRHGQTKKRPLSVKVPRRPCH